MKKQPDSFYAKILLFGEYSILCDSMGLTIPFTHFKAELSFINEDKYTDIDFARSSNQQLKSFIPFLDSLQKQQALHCEIDIESFARDVAEGLYLESTIPQGYGIGSSGALIAAVYKKYALYPIPDDDTLKGEQIGLLRNIFSQLESFFHGTSSGIDPLNCYLKRPLLIRSKTDITFVGIPKPGKQDEGGIFLINTGKPGKTGPLVKSFLEKCQAPDFMNLIREQMIPATNGCINSIIQGNTNDFYHHLSALSDFQLNHMRTMIPPTYQLLWKHGLDTRHFYIKLCGSGGGGFLLGFTKNYEQTKSELRQLDIELIPVYLNF